MTIRTKFTFIGIAALLISLAVIFFTREKTTEGKFFIYALPFHSEWGWGYKIYRGFSADKDTSVDKLYIRQDFMPGIPGKKGFATEADALQVANLVISRISSNQMPGITGKDLDSLGLMPH